MLKTRVIPILLLRNSGLYKTVRFKEPKYIGDPINAVKIFNEKEVDELVFLDIEATVSRKPPNIKLLSDIASECFMPLCYGGGIRGIKDIRIILNIGVEKVSMNSSAILNPDLVRHASEIFGSSTIVVSIDAKKSFWGKYEVHIKGGSANTGIDPVNLSVKMNELGAGELLINSMDRDGTQKGYDIDLISRITKEVDIPVIACGGAGSIADFGIAVKEGGASAVAAGSMFVFQGKHKGVLISYPSQEALKHVID